jgi:hypothetical protein
MHVHHGRLDPRGASAHTRRMTRHLFLIVLLAALAAAALLVGGHFDGRDGVIL